MFPVKLGSVLLFQDAVSKYQEVTNNLEFAKELQRSFMALSQDVSRRQYIYLWNSKDKEGRRFCGVFLGFSPHIIIDNALCKVRELDPVLSKNLRYFPIL